MKSSVEKLSNLGRKLSVEVPPDRVASAFDRVYKQLQKNANIKGFRKGKAPMTMIKSMYADRVHQDVAQDLVSQAYSEALNEHKLSPITQPAVNFDHLEESKGFTFTAEFEVRPQVTVKKYENLKIEKEKMSVDEKQVDEMLERIRNSRTENVPVIEDRPAQSGDMAEIDFAGTVDGQPLEGGQAQSYQLELGSNSFIPGFEEQVIGMKPGQEKTIGLTFPEDYGKEELAGKPVEFKVKLHKLFTKKAPEMNDEFAKNLGMETVGALKDQIRKDLVAEEEARIKGDMRSRILKALVTANPVDVPEQMLENQKQALSQDIEQKLRNQGATDADVQEYKSKWSGDLDETASFMIQSSFLVDKLAEDLKMEPSEKEIQERILNYSQSTGIEIAKLKDYYADSKRKNQLEYQITEEKVVAKLIELAEVKEVAADKLKK